MKKVIFAICCVIVSYSDVLHSLARMTASEPDSGFRELLRNDLITAISSVFKTKLGDKIALGGEAMEERYKEKADELIQQEREILRVFSSKAEEK